MIDIIIPVLIFIFVVGSIGAFFTSLCNFKRRVFENIIMSFALGIAAVICISSLLNILTVPFSWIIFLILSMGSCIYLAVKNKDKIKNIEFNPKFKLVYVILILIFCFTMFLYMKGAFSYSWLGDGDSWHHAATIKYIAEEGTFYEKEGLNMLRYVDPYPPGYDALIVIPYQIGGSMIPLLKFINILILSLGIIFFYFMVLKLTKSRKIALTSTFILAMIPSYLSRFIWSHSLVITLIFPLFYFLEDIKENKNSSYLSGIVLASIFLTQPTQAIKISVLVIIYLIINIKQIFSSLKTTINYFIAIMGGGAFAAVTWWIPMVFKYGGLMELARVFMGKRTLGQQFAPTGGSATRIYSFSDFFYAKGQNMINSPTGIGIIVSIIFFVGIILLLLKYKELLKEKNRWMIFIISWLVFSLLGVNGARLPIGFFAFRFWPILAIPISIISAYAFLYMVKLAKKIGIPRFLIIIALVLGVFGTSGYQKYQLNSIQWSPEPAHLQYGQFEAYSWIDSLPKNTRLYYFCHREKFGDHTVLAYDLYACPWCEDVIKFRKGYISREGFSITPTELKDWLEDRNYEYLMVEGNCVDLLRQSLMHKYNVTDKEHSQEIAVEKTNKLLNDLVSSGLFNVVHQTQGSIIFEV